MRIKELYCEVCGAPAPALITINIEGSRVRACPRCASRVRFKPSAEPPKPKIVKPQKQRPQQREEYDIVDDYAERIRKARIAKGWSEAELAQRLKVSADLVRKMETGKYKPTFSIARSLESLLKIKLLAPIEGEERYGGAQGELTLGDVAVLRGEE